MAKLKLSLWAGNVLQISGLVACVLLAVFSAQLDSWVLQFISVFVAWSLSILCSHCLTHYIVGRIVGIKFTHYFLGRSGVARLNLPLLSLAASKVPILVIKTDKESLSRTGPRAKASMFASGAIVSNLAPILLLAILSGKVRGLYVLLFSGLTLANILFTLYFSPKGGDGMRAMRSLKGA